ncbi:HAMP domain-containing sensor histidine kinase [Rudanella lutea]|uniref:HAMP domain-containing sensor histidine kinase n=1 Tax=Rudanella lutea TaxID=451374 RepID=UPI00037E0C1D|nr:HAMP domain-containing sensor histidine kinase [Rudanella lutea]
MNVILTIRARLALLFTAVVSLLLLIFCLLIYTVAERFRQREYKERLREEALTSVELLFGKETINPDLFKLLDRNQMTVLNQEEIIIYNHRNQIIYESGSDYLDVSKHQLDQIRLKGELFWREGDREIVGVPYADRLNRFVVVTSAIDKYGFSKQRGLAIMLAVGWLLATVVVAVTGYYFAQRMLRPIQRMVQEIDLITASALNRRLHEANNNDELTQLSRRFNRMLDRLEEAFRMQRAFVSNAAHELRTPLTAITGQLEVSLMTDESPADLKATIISVLDDAKGLNRLANGLMSLANASLDESAVRMQPVAVDEVLWQVRQTLSKQHPNYAVLLEQPTSQPSYAWQITGNDSLLQSVFYNLLENGAKFSPNHTVRARLSASTTELTLWIQNDGPPLPADELPHIFKPFRRGSNGKDIHGHGIGLSLTERIVRLHRGRISVESSTEQGTIFTLVLPLQ